MRTHHDACRVADAFVKILKLILGKLFFMNSILWIQKSLFDQFNIAAGNLSLSV